MKSYKTKLRLNTVSSVNNLMGRCINSFIEGNTTEEEARTIGYLANILYKGISEEENLNLEEQKARIENINTRTGKINNLGNDIEDTTAIRKALGWDIYPKE